MSMAARNAASITKCVAIDKKLAADTPRRYPDRRRLSHHVSRKKGLPELAFGLFRWRERVHFPFGSRYGAEFLYCLGLAGT
jgi:hypothetical protein